MGITDVTEQIGGYSILLMWASLIIRARPAWEQHHQRGLWLAILSAAIATTLYQDEVIAWAVHVTGDTHWVTLSRNLVGVLAAGLTLFFLVDSTHGRRLRIISAICLMISLTTLLGMDLAEGEYPGPSVAPAGGPAAPSTAYWVIVCGTHLISDIVAIIVCWQYSRRTGDRDLLWSLRLFAIGSVFAVAYWAAFLIHVYLRMPKALPYMSAVIDVHGLLRAVTLLVPTLTSVVRLARDARTVWILWPMWRDLSAAVPSIALMQPQPTRLGEVLRPSAPLALQAHRQTIETYDAILDLQAHVPEQAYEQALQHAYRIQIPTPCAPAAALAGALGQARRAKLSGAPATGPHMLPGLDHGDVSLLLAMARSWSTMCDALPGNEPTATTP